MPIMPKMHRRIESVIGLDVAQKTVTLHDGQTGATITVDNTLEALLDALAPFRDRQLAVCEATGGHEDKLLAALVSLAIPTHRGDGGKISTFAHSLGRAKTDRIDARMLALYGAERGAGLSRYAPKRENHARLAAFVNRRIELVEMRKVERTRAKAPRASLADGSFDRAIGLLDEEIARVDAVIEAHLNADDALKTRKATLETIPGIAHVTAATLLALMPELGRISRRRAASLAAVAPHPRDSGTTHLRRKTTGGRRALRPILFIAALTATRGDNKLAHFFKRLVQAGKPKRLALVAVMRKIIVIANARLAHAN
jgi:transposase